MNYADIKVELLDSMGSDATVANVARVSFAKEVKTLQDQDVRLINYLAKHGHWSPFAHCFVQFRIKAPLFVARQLVKHQVGLSWNEESRRYIDSEPEFYCPSEFRGRAESVKQGSANNLPECTQQWADLMVTNNSAHALAQYNALLRGGVAPEQARMVLPLNTMTEWIWSGSLMAFARVCQQRLDAHAQKECRDVAGYLQEELSALYPHSFNALMGY
jgi:thymidylate synthase (FAD)